MSDAKTRRGEAECYASVARGLALAALAVAVYVGCIAVFAAAAFEALRPTPVPAAVETISPAVVAAAVSAGEPEKSSPQGAPINPSPLSDSEWAALLTVCEEEGLEVEIALALIQVESGFQRDAISPSGCYGLCQLNPDYFPSGLSQEENITRGIGYLGACLKRYGTLEAALTAYNAGHDTGSRWYADKVLAAAEEWRGKEGLKSAETK